MEYAQTEIDFTALPPVTKRRTANLTAKTPIGNPNADTFLDKPFTSQKGVKKFLFDIGYEGLCFGGISKVFTDREGRKFIKFHASGSVAPNIYLGETTPRDVAELFFLYGNDRDLNLPEELEEEFEFRRDLGHG